MKKFILILLLCVIAYSATLAQTSVAHRKSSNAYRNNFQRVATSSNSYSTFEIRADGTLWAWGYNGFGQLGDGTIIDKINPTQIGTDTKWVTIATGSSHTVALKSDGTLWTWGYNGFGQLGDGTIIDKVNPTQIGTDTKWVTVATGDNHTVALKSDGTLWGWGRNAEGQLGDGTTINKINATQIGTDNKWVTVVGGYHHTTALKSDGTLWAWGYNAYGQLGDGSTVNKSSPVQIGTDNKWVSLAASSSHTVALKSDGTLWAWGNNPRGQLGDGTTVNKSSPVQIGIDNKWVAAACGSQHTIALKSDGTIWAWGWNIYGQLGDGTTVNKSSPVQIDIDTKWISVTAGFVNNIAIKTDGTLWAWGRNDNGQLGDGTLVDKSSPKQISVTDSRMLSVANGQLHTVAIKSDGTMWAWGDNTLGELGDSSTTQKNIPTQIGKDGKWISAVAGDYHTMALKSDGSLWAWGYNLKGQLGIGAIGNGYQISPQRVGTDNSWTNIAAGQSHTVALKSDGTLWAWGWNSNGQLGNGSTTDQTSPIQIGTDSKWVRVSCGGYTTFGLKSDGTLWGWGSNGSGELGIGSAGVNQTSPIQIGTDNKWVNITSGYSSALAIKSDGTLWGWGVNTYGELGDGTTNSKFSPIQIGTDNKWVSTSTAKTYTNGIKCDGTLWGWAANNNGQLGDGTNTYRSTPTQIVSQANVITLYSGSSNQHSGIIKSDSRTLCLTGYNNNGQLGNGTTTTNSNAYSCISFYANTWLGATSNAWATASNWALSLVPTNTDNVTIPAGTLNAPIVSSTQSVNSLTVNSIASLNLTSTLQVVSTLTNNGSITGSGSLTLNGTTAQTIAGTGSINNLILNNSTGAIITNGAGNTQSITGTLTPTLGTLTTNGNLILKSTSITNTAMVGIVGGSIGGDITVERFVPAAQRSFRFLTPGVTTTSSIKTNWQENQNNTSTLFASNSNTNAGYGTHITGSTTGLNGFDATATGGASLFTFSNNSGQAWSSISNTNSNVLSVGTAYRLLVRGSRAVNLSNNASTIDATTLRATGALKTGTVIFNSTGIGTNVLPSPTISATTNDYSFIGNPYWAPVDWNALSKTNVSTTYYLWDPTKAGSNNRGGYVSYTTGSGASGGGTINQYLQPGQGVFIRTSGASPSITFTEANKALSSSNLTTTFRTTNNIDGRLNINLYLQQNYAARKTADAAAIVFSNNFSKAIGNEDAEKFINPDENISIKLNEKLLGLNGIPLPQQQDTVWLNMQNMLGNKYKLEVTGEGFASNSLEAYLMDNYLNTKTAIKLNDSVAIDYSIDNASSAASNRFAIVFEKAKPILLNAALQIKVSPNPVVDMLTINYEGLNEKEATTLSIVDMNGRIVKTIEAGKVPSGNQCINIKGFSNGVYSIQLLNGDNRKTQSFIKQ